MNKIIIIYVHVHVHNSLDIALAGGYVSHKLTHFTNMYMYSSFMLHMYMYLSLHFTFTSTFILVLHCHSIGSLYMYVLYVYFTDQPYVQCIINSYQYVLTPAVDKYTDCH